MLTILHNVLAPSPVPRTPQPAFIHHGVDDAKEQLVVGAVANRDLTVALERRPAVRGHGQPAEDVELHLLSQLVTGIIKIELTFSFDDSTRHDTVFIKGTGDTYIQCRFTREANDFSGVIRAHVDEADAAYTLARA